MAAIGMSTLTLRIFGDTLDPEAVTAMLGAKSTRAFRKGDVETTKGGRQIVHRTGTWQLSVPDSEPEAIDVQVANLLAQLRPDLATWQRLGEAFEVDLFCGLFMNDTNEGFSLSVPTLKALAERGIEIGFDTYAPIAADEEQQTAQG